MPGDNLRKSIFKDGLDKADIALLFFTEESLQSAWVDKEIKHVLREETKKGNDFDLNKIISIFDSKKTYEKIYDRYPELTDDLLHLMPKDYGKIELGQLTSAIWSKYLALQGGDIETQKQLLSKDKELFKKDKEISELKLKFQNIKSKDSVLEDEFKKILKSKKIENFINHKDEILTKPYFGIEGFKTGAEARAFGLLELHKSRPNSYVVSEKGRRFFEWYILNEDEL